MSHLGALSVFATGAPTWRSVSEVFLQLEERLHGSIEVLVVHLRWEAAVATHAWRYGGEGMVLRIAVPADVVEGHAVVERMVHIPFIDPRDLESEGADL